MGCGDSKSESTTAPWTASGIPPENTEDESRIDAVDELDSELQGASFHVCRGDEDESLLFLSSF